MYARMALRQRHHFAALLRSIVHRAHQLPTWRDPDARNLRLWDFIGLTTIDSLAADV